MNKDYEYKIHSLSKKFYEDYPIEKFREILKKKTRPYNCIIFKILPDIFVAIPYRSKVGHKESYLFKTSKRSRQTRSGLDYSKIVVLEDSSYIDREPVVIDQDEYKETVIKIEQIQAEALEYINTYMNHIKGSSRLHKREFERRYGFSTLKYFHRELGLDKEY